MSEKRYFKIEYDEEWYLFDSTTISEQLVKEQAEYGYGVFANSLSPSEVVGLLNEQQSTIKSLKEENDGIKTKGLEVLAFYESKLKNVIGTEDFQSVRDEIWIVRHVLYEMGVINDE